jgi:hypothetical protein
VEQQPRPADQAYWLTAAPLMAAGWFLYLLGCGMYLFLLLPAPVRSFEATMADLIYAPIFLVLMTTLAATLANNGRRYILQARDLLEAARFQSHAILMEVVGTLSRADVKVGKSVADSVESSSVVARSDFTTRFWAAELVSEIHNLRDPKARRDLLGMNMTPENQQWIEHFRHEINRLREEGVRPVGVDLQASEVSDVVRANIGVSAMRSEAAANPQLYAPPGGGRPELGGRTSAMIEMPEDAGPPAGPMGDMSGYRECPQCAEMIRVKAKVCRFCGYRLSE